MTKQVVGSLVLVLVIVISGCSVKVDSPYITVDPSKIDLSDSLPKIPEDFEVKVTWSDVKALLPTCTVTAPTAAVKSGEDVLLQVTATGSTGPFALFNEVTFFDSETTVTRNYTNQGTTNRTVNDTILLRDSVGLTFACGFSVVVLPATTPTGALTCTVSHKSTGLVVGDSDIFTAVASTGEPLQIVSVEPNAGALITSITGNTTTLQFIKSGTQTISVKAKSTSTGTFCNALGAVSETFSVNEPLSCIVYTYYNPSYTWELFDLNVVVPAGSGGTSPEVSEVRTSPYALGYITEWTSPLSAHLYFQTEGFFPIMVRVTDFEGHEAFCSTYHEVLYW